MVDIYEYVTAADFRRDHVPGLPTSRHYLLALSCFLIYLRIETAVDLGDDIVKCDQWVDKVNNL